VKYLSGHLFIVNADNTTKINRHYVCADSEFYFNWINIIYFISKLLSTILKIYLVKSAISRMASSFLTLLKNIIVTLHQFSFARTTQSSFMSGCNISKGGKRRVIKFDVCFGGPFKCISNSFILFINDIVIL
jgi:hypothetical protein